uniref:Glutamate--ammonia ligase n=1 Tax=Populus trichocarpa TaxID=3694 RepID=A0A3N7H9G4_POPTR
MNISGMNGEVMSGESVSLLEMNYGLQLGTFWRGLLRLLELCFHSILKPIQEIGLLFCQEDWKGAGSHTNYCAMSMRNEGGYEVIKKAIEKLGLRHKEHIAVYGERD